MINNGYNLALKRIDEHVSDVVWMVRQGRNMQDIAKYLECDVAETTTAFSAYFKDTLTGLRTDILSGGSSQALEGVARSGTVSYSPYGDSVSEGRMPGCNKRVHPKRGI